MFLLLYIPSKLVIFRRAWLKLITRYCQPK
uniref:ZmAO-1 n=1 Tax=Arundo donax TaxID=35708 RepID=A0A0A9END6_ARUDO